MRRTLLSLFVILALALLSASAMAQEASVELESSSGLASLLGPRVGVSGPPTAFAVQVQAWHEWTRGWALTAGLGLAIGGETQFESSDAAVADASYGSTATPSVAAGLRYELQLDTSPFALFLRGGLLASFVTSGELVGMMIGPEAAFSVSYPLMDELDLVAETSIALGYANYKAAGSTLGATFDVALGAQLRF